MFGVLKELRCQAAMLKRIVRSGNSTYLQYRHYLTWVRVCNRNVVVAPGARSRRKVIGFSEWKGKTLNEGVVFKSVFTSAAKSSSVDAEDENLGVSQDFDDQAFDRFVDAETEDDLAHLRVKLYPLDKDENGRLQRLYEAASIQQVFDIVEEETDSEASLKVASQALVTIWDLQKLLFKISPNFDPERDYYDKPSFIDKVARHPTFTERIMKPVLNSYESLEDEPLIATLLCLQRMNFSIKSPECEKFIDECLRRHETLSLPSISRLCVCMRTESLYGNFVIAKFYPLLWKYIESMSSDLEVRLVSISLRNSLRIISTAIVDKYRLKIVELSNDIPKWETVTQCKVLLLLMACRNLGTESKHVFELVGNALISRIPNMLLMDLLSLQKFLELGFLEPYGLVEALVQRMKRIVQEGVSSSSNPRLDLLSCIAPYLKTPEQRKQITEMLKDYLNNHDFELASGILFTLLRWTRTKDVRLYNQFWNKASDMVRQKETENVLDRRILKLGRDYMNFTFSFNFGYRNRDFEFATKRYIYKMIDNYTKCRQPSLLHPGDFSRAFTFLVGLASLNDPIFYDVELIRILDNFAPQFKPVDVAAISRGLDAIILNLFHPKQPPPKYYDRLIEMCSILEEQCCRVLMDNVQNKNFMDMMSLFKVALVTRRVKGDSPIVDQAVKRMLQCEINDAKTVKEFSQNLLSGMNNYPQANQMIADFIWDSRHKKISPEVIEKFLVLAFSVGWEANDQHGLLQLCSELLTKDWDKLNILNMLQASLGLCFYHHLSKELVQNIFSVEFLDQIDSELAISYSGNQYPMKLRHAMMELNRAVCIDMPDMNLPWFHGKFCEELLSLSTSQTTYLHSEVHNVLASIVGDETAVQPNMCSPYYYKLDFLVEFDEKNRPIKKRRSQPSRFFQKFRGNSQEVKRKVAVLILNSSAFTRNVRSLKGQIKLRKRHLEVLGYDVIEIDPVYWNSMFMSENSVKHQFLESKLYASAIC